MADYIKNPITGCKIKVGGTTYQKYFVSPSQLTKMINMPVLSNGDQRWSLIAPKKVANVTNYMSNVAISVS